MRIRSVSVGYSVLALSACTSEAMLSVSLPTDALTSAVVPKPTETSLSLATPTILPSPGGPDGNSRTPETDGTAFVANDAAYAAAKRHIGIFSAASAH